MSQAQNFEIIVPAGQYFLGDPCYAVRDDDWMPLLESCEFFDEPEGEVKGYKMYASGTAYGDGTYQDNEGNSYPVDAGLIGLVPVSYVESTPANDRSLNLMHKITLDHPTRFGYKDGTIYVGATQIETEGYDEGDDRF